MEILPLLDTKGLKTDPLLFGKSLNEAIPELEGSLSNLNWLPTPCGRRVILYGVDQARHQILAMVDRPECFLPGSKQNKAKRVFKLPTLESNSPDCFDMCLLDEEILLIGYVDRFKCVNLCIFSMECQRSSRNGLPVTKNIRRLSSQQVEFSTNVPKRIFLSIDHQVDNSDYLFIQMHDDSVQYYRLNRRSRTTLSPPTLEHIIKLSTPIKKAVSVSPSKVLLLDKFGDMYSCVISNSPISTGRKSKRSDYHEDSGTQRLLSSKIGTNVASINTIFVQRQKYILYVQKNIGAENRPGDVLALLSATTMRLAYQEWISPDIIDDQRFILSRNQDPLVTISNNVSQVSKAPNSSDGIILIYEARDRHAKTKGKLVIIQPGILKAPG